jgi:tetratricopeptide (TPR) repeat protein
MRRELNIATLVLASLTLGSAAAGSAAGEVSEQTLAALDPTLAGRLTCRGLDASGANIDARLRLAQDLAARQGLGTRPIGLYPDIATTDLPLGDMDPMARRYFEQGLALAYGFNHRAAIRSFQHAREIEPNCAMCWWGEAMANGPNINSGMDAEQNRAALAALENAKRLSAGGNPSIIALIDAQAARFSFDPSADRAALNRAYAETMLSIARANPRSDDLAILAAESAMDTTPWDYWDGETGEPRPLIADAVALIETVMERNPSHPQASHLYIHLLELPQPNKAEAAADRLRQSGPKALGHLVHMPSHIYYRLGRYADSMAVNVNAVAADEAYLAQVADDGLVRYGYYPHNVHFLLTSAQMMGDVDTVITQATKLESVIDVETGRELAWVQAIYAAPYFALAQYGSPEATLALLGKRHSLDYVEAMRRYARAVAYAGKKDTQGFQAELRELEALETSGQIQKLEDGGFPAPLIVRLAAEVAKGRMLMAQSKPEEAAQRFAAAAELQKAIPYTEPPFWYYPVSQSLGSAYYEAGRYEDARKAFRAALFEAPNNALALYGLARTEDRLGHEPEAQAARNAFDKVWLGDDAALDMKRI